MINLIPISQLQRSSKKVIENLEYNWKQIIVSNNTPKAVLLSFKEYNEIMKKTIKEENPDKWEEKSIKNYEEKKKEWNLNWTLVSENYFDNLL